MIGIYKITNKINNKCYIGQSKNIESRINTHFHKLENNCHSNHFQSSFNKYGKDNFKWEILEECLEIDLCNKERYWIKYYKSNNPEYGYNLTSGGENKPGWQQNDEVRNKISEKLKINNSMRNPDVSYRANSLRIWSEESRNKLSNSQKGCFINKNGIQKKIKYSELEEYLNNGWIKGSLVSRSGSKNSMYNKKGKDNPNYGRKAINKNGKLKYVKKDELDSYLNDGWKLGTPSEHNKRISDSLKKRKEVIK